ncbi:uncharacterized protein LOC143019649 [Oratosquilla oratoria]|uniref:uncharacterized protein LOC143019649 n=1 Tax=Oratosquilla oratoria TaxID=337810 RepID=UPI003F764F8A
MKVEELLGEKNATVIGVVQNDLCCTLRKLQTQEQKEDTEELGEEPPQQQVEDESELPQLHWQSVLVQPQPQQSCHNAQHFELLEDGSFVECNIIEPETSTAQESTSTPKLKKCSSVSAEYEQYKAEKRKLKLEKERLKIEKRKIKLSALKGNIELKQKLIRAEIEYYQSLTAKTMKN